MQDDVENMPLAIRYVRKPNRKSHDKNKESSKLMFLSVGFVGFDSIMKLKKYDERLKNHIIIL